MQKEIYLLRHGQSEANERGVLAGWTDVPLTELGMQQAHAAVSKLQALLKEGQVESGGPQGFGAILSSDLARAVQTARPIAQALDIRLQASSALREVNLGRWENQSFDSIQAQEPELAAQWLKAGYNFHYPEGESVTEVIERVIPVIEEALEQHDRILVVAHGGMLSGVIAHYVFSDVSLARGIYVHNACFSRLVRHASGSTLNLLNY